MFFSLINIESLKPDPREVISGFVVHEKLAWNQRELISALAEAMGLPVVKRKALKVPE